MRNAAIEKAEIFGKNDDALPEAEKPPLEDEACDDAEAEEEEERAEDQIVEKACNIPAHNLCCKNIETYEIYVVLIRTEIVWDIHDSHVTILSTPVILSLLAGGLNGVSFPGLLGTLRIFVAHNGLASPTEAEIDLTKMV